MKSNSFLLNALFSIVIAGIASAQSGGPFTIKDATVEGSAHVSSGGVFVSEVRLGQGLAGNAISGQNFSVGGGFYPAPPPPPATLPAAPAGLTAMAVSTSQINLAWVDNSNNENGFAIEMCDSKGKCTVFNEIWRTTDGVTQFAHIGLTRNKTYSYRVRAFNDEGTSAYSNVAKAKTLRR